jgi:hypothetical protein
MSIGFLINILKLTQKLRYPAFYGSLFIIPMNGLCILVKGYSQIISTLQILPYPNLCIELSFFYGR